jgi:hypothetical protein
MKTMFDEIVVVCAQIIITRFRVTLGAVVDTH